MNLKKSFLLARLIQLKRVRWLTILLFTITQLAVAQAPRELSAIFEVAGQDSGALLGTYVKGVGDLNKDGYDDVAVSAPGQLLTYIYYGAEIMNQQSSLILEGGGTITSGDFNGDTWIDLAIEKYYRDTVNIFWGGLNMDEVPDMTLHSENRYDGFGRNSLGEGDINGDGITDLIIGAAAYPYIDTVTNNYWRGKLYIYSGQSIFDSIPIATFTGDTLKSKLGKDLAIGDINNDGRSDIIALGYNQSSSIGNEMYFYLSIYFGNDLFQMHRNIYIDSRNSLSSFRDHIVSFDTDGDNIDDILVNKVYIFSGGNQLDTIPTYYVAPPNNDTISFGSYPWVSGGGDFNGDGFKDMLISRTEGYPFGVPGFYLYLNRLNHPSQYVAYRVFSEYWWHSKLYGRPENAGDVNNDGVDDIITSSPMEYLNNEGFFGIYSGDTTLVTDLRDIKQELPKDFNLKQNYPNPFNPTTTIKFDLPNDGLITLEIFDLLGRRIVTLVKEYKTAGSYEQVFNASSLANGVYFYKLQAGDFISSKKMIFLK